MKQTLNNLLLSKIVNKKLLSLFAAFISYTAGVAGCTASPIDDDILKIIYHAPLSKPTKPLEVFHLGHSLVGRNMPSMLKQLAGPGHNYRSQLGWGTSLQAHWEPDIPIKGFKPENSHLAYQDVFEAIESGKYDAIVLTESVEIKAAIQYKDSAKYLAKFAKHTQQRSPKTRLYFYESWHEVNDKDGWINRLNGDYEKFWLNGILDKALKINRYQIPIYVIPVGQVMSAFFARIESKGGIEGLTKPEDIFAREKDGGLDPIHLNDIGNYLVALVHYAVLYQKPPTGLPYKLNTAKGFPATHPSKEAAELMQSITWTVVSANYRTGLVGF